MKREEERGGKREKEKEKEKEKERKKETELGGKESDYK